MRIGVGGCRLALLALAGAAPSAVAQETNAGMVGPLAASRDFVRDRGFLIAKGTTLPGGVGYVNALGMTLSLGAAYGFTDRLTVHGGTSFWSIAASAPSGYVSARYAVLRVPHAGVAVGAMGVIVAEDGATTAAGWPFVSATAGTDRVAVSGLAGVGSSTEVFESDFNGSLLLEGLLEFGIAPNLKVLVESLYLGEDSDPIGALGFRWSGFRVAVEAGAVHVFESGPADTSVLPWAGVSLRF